MNTNWEQKASIEQRTIGQYIKKKNCNKLYTGCTTGSWHLFTGNPTASTLSQLCLRHSGRLNGESQMQEEHPTAAAPPQSWLISLAGHPHLPSLQLQPEKNKHHSLLSNFKTSPSIYQKKNITIILLYKNDAGERWHVRILVLHHKAINSSRYTKWTMIFLLSQQRRMSSQCHDKGFNSVITSILRCNGLLLSMFFLLRKAFYLFIYFYLVLPW